MESLKEKREMERKLDICLSASRRRGPSFRSRSESFKSSSNGFLYKKPETRHVQCWEYRSDANLRLFSRRRRIWQTDLLNYMKTKKIHIMRKFTEELCRGIPYWTQVFENTVIYYMQIKCYRKVLFHVFKL